MFTGSTLVSLNLIESFFLSEFQLGKFFFFKWQKKIKKLKLSFMAYQSIPGPGSGSSSGSGYQFLNSPFGDTTYTKVFVGGLAWETQSETMRRYFEQFGEILEAVVITDKNSGRSKGYGFVSIYCFQFLGFFFK